MFALAVYSLGQTVVLSILLLTSGTWYLGLIVVLLIVIIAIILIIVILIVTVIIIVLLIIVVVMIIVTRLSGRFSPCYWWVEPHVQIFPHLKTARGQTRLTANDLGFWTTVCPRIYIYIYIQRERERDIICMYIYTYIYIYIYI